MKTLFLLILIFFSSELLSQIPKVEISNHDLLKAIDLFIDSLKLSDRKGSIVVEIKDVISPNIRQSNDPYERESLNESKWPKYFSCALIFQPNISSLKRTPPESYSIHRNIPILFYIGLDYYFVKLNNKDIDDLSRKLRFYFPLSNKNDDPLPEWPVWHISLKNGRIYFDR